MGSEITNWTPMNAMSITLTNNLFIRLRSWIDSDNVGIPDWWQLLNFGYVGIDPNEPDPAGDGWTNYQKFAMGINPSTWVTPPPPPGAFALYNSHNQTVTLTWQPSQGNVTGYIVSRSVPPDDYENLATLPATATNFIDSSPATNFPPEEGVPYYYLQATYAPGNSLIADLPMF
jgi:hypothetical protein